MFAIYQVMAERLAGPILPEGLCVAHLERLGQMVPVWIPTDAEAESIATRLRVNYKRDITAAQVIRQHRDASLCKACHDGFPIHRAELLHEVDDPNRKGKHKIRTRQQVQDDLALGSKVCTRCEERKPFTCFPKQAKSPDGYTSLCSECSAERWREAR